MNRVRQCGSCPWRKDCVPDRDIPHGYSRELHEALRDTIAKPGDVLGGLLSDTLRIMACHHSPPGAETPCAGWLANQLGPGNNIALRIAAARGEIEYPIVTGEQCANFDETLR